LGKTLVTRLAGRSFGGSLEGKLFGGQRYGNLELSGALPTRSRVGVA
jgi:hypothetical protein